MNNDRNNSPYWKHPAYRFFTFLTLSLWRYILLITLVLLPPNTGIGHILLKIMTVSVLWIAEASWKTYKNKKVSA
ncbi:MAG TPA: hypothetical protein DIT08_01315 [Enterococcus sp.]|uniref:Uncharacterized protein n=1 Tax=Enterococcus malodoratus ATCC 43197 TaxID=1158601 RepID=R2NL99_9ENTE|nr:hypothetical protein UAI_03696 [Enterococcus malodoratus ATCC 43197]EOT67360.1 hypothetical protein I585_02881 [Enterococcus malodoratus ATCC 43197]SPX03183.1 Uncharacterised protein [Enterococcus malodoratus]STD69388.1 Uncharacterised protein [Enterococcus malodoratus]HCM84720.1 hypothetical protein [Enterococcus sp.]